MIPDTAPNQFDPEAMLRSAHLACSLRPEALLFAHFGRYPRDCETLRRRLQEQVNAFVALGRTGAGPAAWERVQARLVEHVQRDLAAQGLAWTPAIEAELAEHLEVSAQGIVDYHERRTRSG